MNASATSAPVETREAAADRCPTLDTLFGQHARMEVARNGVISLSRQLLHAHRSGGPLDALFQELAALLQCEETERSAFKILLDADLRRA